MILKRKTFVMTTNAVVKEAHGRGDEVRSWQEFDAFIAEGHTIHYFAQSCEVVGFHKGGLGDPLRNTIVTILYEAAGK